MKKILFVCLALFMAAAAFSQSAKATGLTDSDVTSFCKNFKKLESDFKKLGLDLEDREGVVAAVQADKKVIEVLNKNGITGGNAVDKLKALGYGYAVECYDDTLAKDPETAAMVKNLGIDPIAEARKLVADADKNVVKRHLKELKKVFNDD